MVSDMTDSLDRFVDAQESVYEIALEEIRSGEKQTHWMWYIFPQMKGLGKSHNAKFYGISDHKEAKAYLNHPVLGRRLREITSALLNLKVGNINEVLGKLDAMKLKSSMTMFDLACPDDIFERVLIRFFNDERCHKTTVELSKKKLFNALTLPMCVMLTLIILGILSFHLELCEHGFQAIMVGFAFECILIFGLGYLLVSIIGAILTFIGYFRNSTMMFYAASIFSTYLFLTSIVHLFLAIGNIVLLFVIGIPLLFWSGYLMIQTICKMDKIAHNKNKTKCIFIAVGLFILSLIPSGVVLFMLL
jgi:uncharacterized protein (DUF1810 family)